MMSRAGNTFCIALACVALATALATFHTPVATAADRPIAAEVYVKSSGKAAALRGSLVRSDDKTFTLHVGIDDRTLAWTDITPATAFALKQKMTDRTKADQCLALGQFG